MALAAVRADVSDAFALARLRSAWCVAALDQVDLDQQRLVVEPACVRRACRGRRGSGGGERGREEQRGACSVACETRARAAARRRAQRGSRRRGAACARRLGRKGAEAAPDCAAERAAAAA